MSEAKAPNRLLGETSPYLLQHAYNPVDWYPWGPEALARAASEDKPILLSIGYAACHWCHVMERESFEDESTARFMNEHFVCVKVDREERPDLDSVYMDAVQAMTGQGGWPMTVFLTPDGAPFYAGTYFPKEDRHGLPAFRRVLDALATAWGEQRDRALEQGQRVVEVMGRMSLLGRSDQELTEEVLDEATEELGRSFDARWGGFGGAPKFPQPMTLEFLLRRHVRGDQSALAMVELTLDRMADGGIHDQLAGGFHRYSVDDRWHVPHFEKMLYDNAQLARLYVHAWQVTGRERYRRVTEGTVDYLLREMRHPAGAFFSSQDADSEGEEGTFFAWTHDELVRVASATVNDPALARTAASYLGARPEGNWEHGRNVLWTPEPLEAVASATGMDSVGLEEAVASVRRALWQERERRPHPATDDKILAAWNGLAITALAEAGRALGATSYVDAAVTAADFIMENLHRDDGRLLRSWRDGRPGVPGYLDDHAMMAEACLTLWETTFDVRHFRRARDLAVRMIELFADEGRGFFQTGSDAETLVIRPKELFDNAIPSGNSVAATVLLRLAHLTGDESLELAGAGALRLVREQLPRAPSIFGAALSALDLFLSPSREVAIVGDPAREDTIRLLREVHTRFLPNTVLAGHAPGDPDPPTEIPLLRDRPPVDGKATAYVCERFVCRRPVTDPAELAEQLA